MDELTIKDGMKKGFGVVYLLEFEDGVLKFGISTKPKERFDRIEKSSGRRIKKYYLSEPCSNFFKIETEVKNKFDDDKLNGEFIRGDFDEIKNFIKTRDKEFKEKYDDSEVKIKELVKKLFNSEVETSKRMYPGTHCDICCIPNDVFEYHLESFQHDNACELVFDFYYYVIDSSKKVFSEKELVSYLKEQKVKYPETENFNEVIEELFELLLKWDILTKKNNVYVNEKLKQVN